MVIQRSKVPITVLVFGLILAIGNDGIRLASDRAFNAALAKDEVGRTDEPSGVYRQFARAFSLQQQPDFKAAVAAYAIIDAEPHSRMHLDIKYNLANLYFREAMRLRDEKSDDLAMPLLELAKQNYVDVLRVDSDHWDAKYNLELALILSPELDPADPMEERNPEHSPRALTVMPSREPLP
ncbi:MAG: hypothetical protein OEW68_03950 [Gammaproteobacteria bacterium]|nr:hypothetical protein [Gammaproteobacteria bacterium]MDH4313974.1 hypothetical protein [Gammaproteobacteria bacterium]MDH5212708.1 hypothetical protein [Gammaproteobacteria bacterium]MDH5500241.1 hypothetical protein [Gammaproteobacteria bacterium]